MNQANCIKTQDHTYFSNENDFLGVLLNNNFYLYELFCIWPGFIAYYIYLENFEEVLVGLGFDILLMIISCWQV